LEGRGFGEEYEKLGLIPWLFNFWVERVGVGLV